MVYDILEWAEEQHANKTSCSPYPERMMKLIDISKIAKKQQEQCYYLMFWNLERHGEEEECLLFGKMALVQGAKVKTRLKELFKEVFGEDQGRENWKQYCAENDLRV